MQATANVDYHMTVACILGPDSGVSVDLFSGLAFPKAN
jgi:hypothetical protein